LQAWTNGIAGTGETMRCFCGRASCSTWPRNTRDRPSSTPAPPLTRRFSNARRRPPAHVWSVAISRGSQPAGPVLERAAPIVNGLRTPGVTLMRRVAEPPRCGRRGQRHSRFRTPAVAAHGVHVICWWKPGIHSSNGLALGGALHSARLRFSVRGRSAQTDGATASPLRLRARGIAGNFAKRRIWVTNSCGERDIVALLG